MLEDTIVITAGLVAVIIILAAVLWKLRSAETKMHDSTHKLKVYTDLLNAITEPEPGRG